MDEELNEFHERAEFDETILRNLSNHQALYRRIHDLDETHTISIMNGDVVKVPRQMTKVKEGQVENAAGGFVFPVSDETQVRRFLIIGSESGSYYQPAVKITMNSAKNIIKIIESGNGHMVLRELALINAANRNPKMSSMLFTLAICARFSCVDLTRKTDCPLVKAYRGYIWSLHNAAFKLIPKVCRIPTHLFEFVKYCELIAKSTKLSKASTGWGRGLRTAISSWYTTKTADTLAMYLTKYPQREGWSHRDLFRLAHPSLYCYNNTIRMNFNSSEDRLIMEQLFRFAVKGDLLPRMKKRFNEEKQAAEQRRRERYICRYSNEQINKEKNSSALNMVEAYLRLKNEKSEEIIVEAIKKHRLVREHLPTDSLNSKLVWETLFDVPMPMTAMIRNLAKMTVVGALDDNRVDSIVKRLTDVEELRQARIHPLNLLTARAVYAQGRGDKGSLTWEPNQKICDALEAGFYKAFINAPATNKRYCIALDVSESMRYPVSSSPLSCREAAAGMSLITLHNESDVKVVAFTDELTELPFTKDWTIPQVNDYVKQLHEGATHCGLPMMHAIEKDLKFDVFIIYTDNDTRVGNVHPFEAIKKYREHSGIHDAKVIVCAMQACQYTIADPSDAGMLDIAGFDSAVPTIINEFALGNI